MASEPRAGSIAANASLKEEAEFYRAGLLLGLIPLAEAIAWCDAIIMAETSPDIAIIEASISGSSGVNSVANALSQTAGEFSDRAVTKRIFSAMHDMVSEDRKQAPNVARQLFQMAADNDVANDGSLSAMLYFYDAIDDAVNGYYGDEEELIDEMLQFLKEHSAPESRGFKLKVRL